MSRIRTIKPEFWQHEELSTLPEGTHILAAALLNYSDDEGFFNANPRLVKAACLPLREDSVSIHESLNLLCGIGFIRIGTAEDGKRYGHIVNFLEHQRINRPTKSKINELKIKWDESHTTHTQLSEDSQTERKGKEEEGKGRELKDMSFSSEEISSPKKNSAEILEIFTFWQEKLNHPNAKLDVKRKTAIERSLRAYKLPDLILAIDGCSKTPWNMGENPNGVVYDDLTLILKDASNIERFMKHSKNPPKPTNKKTNAETAQKSFLDRINGNPASSNKGPFTVDGECEHA